MNIQLSPDLEKFIHDKINSGVYNSASEVIQQALQLLRTHEEIDNRRRMQLNKSIVKGLLQIEQGLGIEAKTAYQYLRQKINLKQS